MKLKNIAVTAMRRMMGKWDDRKLGHLINIVQEIEPSISFSYLDIGARGGLEGAKGSFRCLKQLNNLFLAGVEPDPEECERLKTSGGL